MQVYAVMHFYVQNYKESEWVPLANMYMYSPLFLLLEALSKYLMLLKIGYTYSLQ